MVKEINLKQLLIMKKQKSIFKFKFRFKIKKYYKFKLQKVLKLKLPFFFIFFLNGTKNQVFVLEFKIEYWNKNQNLQFYQFLF